MVTNLINMSKCRFETRTSYSTSTKAQVSSESALMDSSFVLIVLVLVIINVTNGQPLVPALFIFGDSVVDNGNNNNRLTVVKANHPPYGRDFQNHIPTGRFSNGKLATDFVAEALGFTSYQPAYLNLETKGQNLLNGANFASAASSYLDASAIALNVVPLTQQLEHYKECQNILVEIAGESNALSIISDAIYVICTGNVDFILNYYTNPVHSAMYTPAQFSDLLLQKFSMFVQNLYALGARKIGVTTLPPLGCMPASITLFGLHNNGCVEKMNNAALIFNAKQNATCQKLRQMLPGLNLVLLDIYSPLYELITKPTNHGFFEARKGCCGTGLVEATILLCNKFSEGTCANASEYVFWDSFHPTETANMFLADHVIAAGISLIN